VESCRRSPIARNEKGRKTINAALPSGAADRRSSNGEYRWSGVGAFARVWAMKRWALVVLGLYLLILIVFTVPVIMVCFVRDPGSKPTDAFGAYACWPYWLWLAVMVLSQAALLKVPVSLAERRPVSRRSLLLPVIVAGLMMGSLVTGGIYSLAEAVFHDHVPTWIGWGGPAAGILTWCFWGMVFSRMSRHPQPGDALHASEGKLPASFFRTGPTLEPDDLISRQCRLLLKGSILELLVAVPSHIWVRRQHYCCAGFMTFIGITFGLSVMLFSFGPAVFFLYVDRWRRLQPKAPE
jgi:hypothetical protein